MLFMPLLKYTLGEMQYFCMLILTVKNIFSILGHFDHKKCKNDCFCIKMGMLQKSDIITFSRLAANGCFYLFQ